MAIAQSQMKTPAQRMRVEYWGFMGMPENGDHANRVFAFFRPHVASMFVLNRQRKPQTANIRIISTNQTVPNVVMRRASLPALSG
jgi:hypothetical protein